MLKLLAFDYGAGSGRAIVGQYDGKRLKLGETHRFSNEPVSIRGSLYWDILRLYHEMKVGIKKSALAAGKDIASIGIDSWGVDFGLLDAAGKLLENPYHYRDSRTEGMIDEACRHVSRREIYERTGVQFLSFNTLYQLLSMKAAGSPVLESARTMLFIPDLLRYFLTGEKNSEYTIASTSQMLDQRTGCWALPLLDKLGLSQGILAEIINPGTIAGRISPDIAEELGINAITVAAAAEHDTASAVASVPAASANYAYLSSGTWSLLGVESPVPIINAMAYGLNYANEGGFNRSVRFLKNIMGLWIYQECKREWDGGGNPLSHEALLEGARSAEPFKALIDPDDAAFLRPGNMPRKVQDYCAKTGETVPETKPQIVRCIMESLALRYRMAIEQLEQITGYRIPVLHIVGGGSQNTLLNRFTADAIARPVIAGPVEATSCGNLLVQLIALGEIKSLTDGRAIVRDSFPVTEYAPSGRDSWDAAYGRFKSICDRSPKDL